MTEQASRMPPLVEQVLTRHLPCAGLALMMFAAPLWGIFFSAVMPLALLVSLAGMGLNLMVPALFALIVFGGGLFYAMQVAAIAAVVVTIVTGFSLSSGMFFLLLYALLPAIAAYGLTRPGGLRSGASLLVFGLLLTTMVDLTAGAIAQGLDLRSFTGQLVAPAFDMMAAQVPAMMRPAVEEARQMMVLALPGFIAFGLWLIWWLDLLLGRHVADKYGFYRGDRSEMLMLRFGKVTGIALIVAAALAIYADGSLQYVAISAAIMLAGLMMLQGISIAHLWLRMRNMYMTLVVMYLLLLKWPAMIVPFIIAGLLDIWFDFRRRFLPADGEE